MIQCPKCRNMIPNKSEECPYCGGEDQEDPDLT